MDQDALILQMLAAGATHCVDVAAENSGTLTGLFLVGLSGGISHCAGMCGPFVLAQVSARLEAIPASEMSEFRRLSGAALLPYHFGRMTTYTLLGVVAAALVGGLTATPLFKWAAAALLAVAALVFLGQGLKNLGLAMPSLFGEGTEGWLSKRLGRAARGLFAHPVGWRGYALGVVLGLLPCGLVYGAMAAAGATGELLGGAFVMMAFAAGTIPSLIGVGLFGHVVASKWPEVRRIAAPVILIGNAAWLAWMAASMAM